MVEATSAAEGLQKSLDAEASDRSALEAVVTSACEGLGYVLPDDETEAQEEVQRLEDAAAAPGDALAAFFDDEVELPPLEARGPGEIGQ